MKKIISKLSVVTWAAMFPMVTFAISFGSSGQKKDLLYIVKIITGYLQVGLALIMSLATIFFVWNVFRYFFRPEQDRKEAATYVMYALIGFFVILSMFGLVNLLRNTFNLDDSKPANFQGDINVNPNIIGQV